jgi:hypothetical protein
MKYLILGCLVFLILVSIIVLVTAPNKTKKDKLCYFIVGNVALLEFLLIMVFI